MYYRTNAEHFIRCFALVFRAKLPFAFTSAWKFILVRGLYAAGDVELLHAGDTSKVYNE